MNESIYGAHLPAMEDALREVQGQIEALRSRMRETGGADPVDHILARIKSEESMREKCRRKGLPENEDSALRRIRDAIGIRVVCPFVSDVYAVRDALAGMEDVQIAEEKDYIRSAKPNGYRSYHIILDYRGTYFVEVQIRTISMDTWAALEHQMKYKQNLGANTELIVAELKRCADELASTDLTMQTIREMIAAGEA